jgi:hypothetical protein
METFKDIAGAERAFQRVQSEIESLDPQELQVMNVDLISATSLALGVADRILAFRPRMAKLAQSAEFDLRNVDNLEDYALACWFAYVTNLPQKEPGNVAELIEEVVRLRAKLLMWAVPLVGSGLFEQAAIDRIKEGSGHKDAPSDLVALVGLYRSKWEQAQEICGVTEQDLSRGAEIGPQVFALVSRRENKAAAAAADGAQRVRRAWSLLDRAYAQCQRAIQFIRFDEGDANDIAPSLRRTAGPSASARAKAAAAAVSEAAISTTGAAAANRQTAVGDGAGPFAP